MSSNRAKLDLAACLACPLAVRLYQAAVAGLAAFLITLVVWREPFRGYLAEARLSGPAIEGLDLSQAALWIKQLDSHATVVALPAGEISPQAHLRMTYTALRPAPAIARLDELGGRWLCHYLPDQLQSFRRQSLAEWRTAVTRERDLEDVARARLEQLRQAQLATLQPRGTSDNDLQNQVSASASSNAVAATNSIDVASVRKRLESLRADRSRLLARFTEEHPEVVALDLQILRAEQELTQPPPRPTPPGSGQSQHLAPSVDQRAGEDPHRVGPTTHFVSTTDPASVQQPDFATLIAAALHVLNQASNRRQQAEHRLNDRMQELTAQPTAAAWTAGKARVVARLGGTPRSVTLALGAIVATMSAIVVFWGLPCAAANRIRTVGELATALEIPVLSHAGSAAVPTGDGAQQSLAASFRTQSLRLLVVMGEIVVAASAVACVMAILAEPGIAREIVSDPFGAWSEAIGRLIGR